MTSETQPNEKYNQQKVNPTIVDGHGTIVGLFRSEKHSMKKINESQVRLIEGFGVEGDVHGGEFVQHIFAKKKDPTAKNLRQVHLLSVELFEEYKAKGFQVQGGEMGENILTKGIDLLSLPQQTELHIGEDAVIVITGLRNPCGKLNLVHKGLKDACLESDSNGQIIRKGGIMAIVLRSGTIQPCDPIRVCFPSPPYKSLEVV
jgi:MOSC domain-containing protein YiiM